MALPPPTADELDRIKVEPKCGLCSHERRDEIELILAYRQRRLKLPTGETPNIEWLQQIGPERWGLKMHSATITNHMSKHCVLRDPGATGLPVRRIGRAQAVSEYLQENPDVIADLKDEPAAALAEHLLRETVVAGIVAVRAAPENVSPELAVRAADSLMRKRSEDATAWLMAELVGAIGSAHQRHIEQAAPEPAIEVEAEAVEAE